MTADCYKVITAVVGVLSKVVISTYHHGYVPDSFLEDHQRLSVYLANMRAVFVVRRRLSRSLLNVKLSHAPVGLSYYAVNASSGDAVKSIY